MARNTMTAVAPTGEKPKGRLASLSLKADFAPEVGAPACIHENFEAQAARTPDAIALSFGNTQVSYAELDALANKLVRRLQSRGVGPEIPVALYLDRSIEMVVAILAVLKAGGAYVPIDLAYPRDRVAFMLQDSAAPIVLTQNSLKNALPETSATILCVDNFQPIADDGPALAPMSKVSGANPAYIIYTSGSTGKPKGVIVTHWNVVRLLRSTEPWFRFHSSDVWPLFHSYSFDMSVWELWGSLFYGGRLVIVPQAVARSPFDFYALLAREKVTFLNQTPSAFRQLIWADATAAQSLDLRLRCVTCGGEALELQSLRPWFDRHGDKQPVIVNMYGITETTVHSTYRPITRADLDSGVGSVLGVPIPDLQIHLLDDHLQPVPKGTPGEICVGGAGVARGYLNRPELAAQRFVPDPFAGGNAIMYRSGDLAQVNAFGEMEYLGRMDHQVKIRGFRVELGEIESALNRHSSIRESVVLARDIGSEKRLVAYFVPAKEAPGTSDLRAYLAPMLPEYMVPAVFVPMKAFPLTNNGKIDRRALPEPGSIRPDLSTQYVEPRTDTERTLTVLWQEVLGVTPIGINDNFFELGGDSIRAIVLLAKAAKQGLRYSVEQLFQTPTIAGLAAREGKPQLPAPDKSPAPFSLLNPEDASRIPEGVEDAYPIAALQLGMFFHNEMDPLSPIYHDVFSYEVGAAFDPAKLEFAARMLIDRHPMLRTSFHLSEFSQPLQLVHSRVEVPFTAEDNRTLPAPERSSHILQWIETEKRRAFDRAVAPLMRFHVQRQTDDTFQLFVSFHHSCTDGWSLALLVTELLRDYSTLLAGGIPATSAPDIGYRDFIALERATTHSPESIDFWKRHLEEAPPQKLPRWGRDVPRLQDHAPDSHVAQVRGPEIQIPQPILEGLKELAQRAGLPLKTVLLAAHMRVMALLAGQRDIVTGLVSNGRPEQTGADRLVGLFLNTVPIRQQISPGSWIDLVRQTFAAEQAILPHRRFPLAEIQKLHGQSLLESAFDFVNFHVINELRSCGNLRFAEGPYFEANNLATYTTFILDPTATRLELHIDFDPREITRQQVDHFDNYYLRTLEAMASEPDNDWTASSPMPDEESRQILLEWNETTEPYDQTAGIHELFERQALENPDAPAAECNGLILTYSELNTRANCLAAALAAHGVKPEAPIGLCVERSPNMLVGLLGILKSGAAYVPLDPAFPRERLTTIVRDADIRFLITEEAALAAIPQTDAQVISLDAPEATPARLPLQKSGGRSLAYIIYTSGSTGVPKGVQIEHRSVVNLLLSAARKLELTKRDRLLAVTTLSFDIAGLELFMPLVTGGTVIIAKRDTTTDGPALANLLETSRATVMQATPSTWRMLIEAGWKRSPGLKAICGGEALSPSLANELCSRCREVWNFYGPTETTIWSTACKMDDADFITIGRPLANTQAYILDAQMSLMPVGAIGELLLGGLGLARGYWNREALTSERFIPHPFMPGERVYRTGDLARFLPDGRIECLGRMDHQVKIRGYRIELGDVESALGQHGKVRQALVTALEDKFGDKRLTAYVVPKNGSVPLLELRSFLAGKLPAYMVPAHFIQLKELPMTPNGKVDHRQLPRPEVASEAVAAFVSPVGQTEISLSEIWQQVLSVPRVGAEDNFFDLGADSLSATRAYARIIAAFGSQITLREIFDKPTIRSLAKTIAGNNGGGAGSSIKRQPRVFLDLPSARR